MNPTVLKVIALLVPLAPLLSALFTARRSASADQQTYRSAWWGFVVGLGAAVVVLVQLVADPTPIHVTLFESPWHFLGSVALTIDRLAAVMMVMISGLGALLYRFSIRYLQQDLAQPRFQTLMALCVSTLLLMVSASDLVTLVVSWQLLSWFLPLLTHNFGHEPTARSSFRIFATLRLGDVAFLAGIALAYRTHGTLEFAPLFERAASDTSVIDLGFTTLRSSTAVLLLIFAGAMCKSAQFPLHLWLPESLFAPTPVSGLLHAGIINSGGFLLNRLAPLYAGSTSTLHLVFFVGLVTMIVGTAMMLVQNDIKKALVYSTIGQMGFMIMECGVGAFALAVFHLIAHGLFKATLFLNSGDVIRQARIKPKFPPVSPRPGTDAGTGRLIGFLASLALPLGILVVVHESLGINVKDAQGLQIFLFFSWMTASHAMLTLYRVKKSGAFAQGTLLFSIAAIAALYLFTAEVFAHFIYIDGVVVQSYFDAAALPEPVFFGVAGVTVLLMGVAWVLAYRDEGGPSGRFQQLRIDVYLTLMNDFYVHGVGLRVHAAMKRALRRMERTGIVGVLVLSLAALAGAALAVQGSSSLSSAMPALVPCLLCGLALPLFPLHGPYVAAVTRGPRAVGVIAALLMPVVGICILVAALPRVPADVLPAIEILALVGAAYGSMKALAGPHARSVIAYGSVAMHSIVWWHVAGVGRVTPSAVSYGVSMSLAMGGLLMIWSCIRARYGDIGIHELGGLFRKMPSLAFCMALLVMAATGLLPSGVLFGLIGMLTDTEGTLSPGSILIFAAWFASSWYLFRLMQRLLFGPPRRVLRYGDLGPAELTTFALVIGALMLVGVAPHAWLDTLVGELASALGGAA